MTAGIVIKDKPYEPKQIEICCKPRSSAAGSSYSLVKVRNWQRRFLNHTILLIWAALELKIVSYIVRLVCSS